MFASTMYYGRRLGEIGICLSTVLSAEPSAVHGSVVINEVMANVRGPENTFGSFNEFLELHNFGGEQTDLTGWTISDGDAADRIVPWTDSLGSLGNGLVLDTYVVEGGAYCLILDRDYAQAPDSEGYMPYDPPAGTVILTTENSTIGNGLSPGDAIALLDQSGDTIDTYGTPCDPHDSIPFDPGDGISVERIFPTGIDENSNWSASVSSLGYTPGAQNSVTPYTGVGLSWEDVRTDPQDPSPGERLTVSAMVHNRSTQPAKDIDVTFYVDQDGDSDPGDGEIIGVIVLPSLDPFDGRDEAIAEWASVPTGCHRVGVQVMDSISAFRPVRVGHDVGFVVLNEIMYDPDLGGEWVEIHNWSPHELSLSGWTLGDGIKSCIVCDRRKVLRSGEFAVLCTDTSDFTSVYPGSQSILLEPDGFPSLNNAEDSLIMREPSGFVMDRLHYLGTWGGGDGVSLERVSPTSCTDQRSNWGSCVDPVGATPGEANSIYAVLKPGETTLNLSPNPFSPDGDGFDDRTAISYSLPFTMARLSVIVYDRNGNIVREILQGRETASTGTVLWDGRDRSGCLLPMGVYLVYVEASDIVTGAMVSSKTTVVLARRLD